MVDRARDQLLAGAGLAVRHGRFALHDLAEGFDITNRGRVADDLP
jgi:hypothetical protein